MYKDENRILIAGAGIGGLTAAYALSKKGYSVEVFDQAKAPILEPGVGVRLWSNATTALSRIEIREQIRHAGATIEKVEIRGSNGLLLSESSLRQLAKRVGTPSIGIRYSALIQILLDACRGVAIHFGTRVVGFVPGAEHIGLRLEGEQEVTGNLVIGADGFGSVIRAQLVGDGAPSYSGHMLWQGISDSAGDLRKGIMHIVWGPKNLHCGCWHIDDDHVAWFIRVDTPITAPDSTTRAKPRLVQLVKSVHGPFTELIEFTPEEHISCRPVYVRGHSDFRRLEPVALLGDASHAMPNVLGQTLSQTIEDGVVLAQSLAKTSSTMKGLALYETRRQPRLQWVREQVYRYDKVEEANHPFLFWLRTKASQVFNRTSSKKMWWQFVKFPD